MLRVNYKLLLKQAVIISLFVFPIAYINYRDVAVPEESVWLINLKLIILRNNCVIFPFIFFFFPHHVTGIRKAFWITLNPRTLTVTTWWNWNWESSSKDNWVQLRDLFIGFDGLCRQEIQFPLKTALPWNCKISPAWCDLTNPVTARYGTTRW